MSHKKEIFLLPYAHLDTQWRWEYPTTIKKYILSTLEDNIRLFEKYPEYRFNFTGAIRYAMMKEYYPDLFQKMKKYVDEGRWFFSGTCLEETDPLSPSVESMIRNILYGDRWAKENLGRSSRDYLIPDCFGFPANFPTVLTHCGLHEFSTQKLTWGSANGIPFEIGKWQGPDGSEILCTFNPGSYGSRINGLIQNDTRRMEKLNRLGEKNGVWKSFQYYGTGDIGGAPKEDSVIQAIASIKQAEADNSGLIIKQGSPDQFFEEFTEEEKQHLDTYAGDLLLINHSAGSLTSAAIMKRWNRKNEQMAFAAEVAAVTAWLVAGAPYPTEKIKSAWYRTIGNQMHDILPGTSTPTAYDYSQNDEVVALNTWTTILEDAAKSIAPTVKGNGDILVFNPLGDARNDAVDFITSEWKTDSLISDADGNVYPVQARKLESDKYQLTFIPDLNPFSWTRFSIVKSESNPIAQLKESLVNITSQDDHYVMENANYRIIITNEGSITSIFQKTIKKELLKAPLAYEFQKERPMLFPAWNMDWGDRKNPPFHRIEGGGSVTVLEKGPIRCTLQIKIRYHKSEFVKEISLCQGSSVVEFTERIHWREQTCSLKLALNANIDQPEVNFNWETSRMPRPVNHEKQFEMPSRFWADIGNQNWGISLIEDSKYGYDRPNESTLRMTLLYTPGVRYVTGYWDQKWQDWGEHTIRYSINGHSGDFKDTERIARGFNQRPRVFSISSHLQDIPTGNQHISLFSSSNPQIGILAVKKAEDSDDVVLRVYDRYGKKSTFEADLTCIAPIQKIQEINGLEESIGDIPNSGNKFRIEMKTNQLRSFIITFKDKSQVKQVKQETVKLDYNISMIGQNGDLQTLFPEEIVPSTIHTGPISFNIALGEKFNALQCQGQKISIPSSYNTLSILANAHEACDAVLNWVDQSGHELDGVKCHVSAATGFLGQWDRRKWLRKPNHYIKLQRDYAWVNICTGVQPGFINRNRLEWYATHTYQNREVQPYHYGYLYTITLEIPKNATKIVLPTDKRIFIYGIVASEQVVEVKNVQYLWDKYDF